MQQVSMFQMKTDVLKEERDERLNLETNFPGSSRVKNSFLPLFSDVADSRNLPENILGNL